MLDIKQRQRLAITASQLCIPKADLAILIKRLTGLDAEDFKIQAMPIQYKAVIDNLTERPEYKGIFKMRAKIRSIAKVFGWSVKDVDNFCHKSNKLANGIPNKALLDYYNYKQLNKLVSQFEQMRNNNPEMVFKAWKITTNPENN